MSPVPSFAGSQFGEVANYRANDESQIGLRREVARLHARTRIVADPSIATSFKRDEDPELYDLFLK